MQKVRTRPDPSVYADSGKLTRFWSSLETRNCRVTIDGNRLHLRVVKRYDGAGRTFTVISNATAAYTVKEGAAHTNRQLGILQLVPAHRKPARLRSGALLTEQIAFRGRGETVQKRTHFDKDQVFKLVRS